MRGTRLSRSWWARGTLLLLVALLLAGALRWSRTASNRVAGIDAATYPFVDSSTVTKVLSELLAARALGLDAKLERRRPRPSEGIVESAGVALADPHARPRLNQLLADRVQHSKTNGAYLNLVRGVADLILVSRRPSPDELDLARKAEVELDVRPIALDALVFAVHERNPVTGLSLDQCRGIFSGRLRRWNEVGGPDETIVAHTRNRNSGAEELMRELVMHDEPTVAGPDLVIETMLGTIQAVTRNPWAIGYTVYYYDRVLLADHADRLLAIDGVVPSPATIANRSYPLVTPVFVATRRADAPDSPACRLRDWLLGPGGQRLVAASGYVPLPKYGEVPR